MRATVLLAIAACGGSSNPPPAPPATTVIATPRLTGDDVEVARVNGRPVWSSCVATQAAAIAGAADRRRDALDQCVAAPVGRARDRRGLGRDARAPHRPVVDPRDLDVVAGQPRRRDHGR
ncbi:MAG TPA: hypothetical protein VFD36_03745, partial [Kofleriaceae bacterium]|nr:hypothetical protein [Kofleriaceae bacterium]